MDVSEILTGLYSEQGRQNPYPFYAALHEHGPINAVPARAEHSTVSAVAGGYDVVDQILRDPGWYKGFPPGWEEQEILRTFLTSMMFVNPPDHTRMRAVFARTFTPRRLGALEPVIERIVAERLDHMAEVGADGHEVDFVADFAYPVPALVMAEFIGLPAADLSWYRQRVDWIDEYMDVSGKTPERLARANQAAEELRVFYRDLIAHRRRTPGHDLISGLAEVLDAGGVDLTEDELISNLIVLFNASFVTTVYMFSNGLPLLLDHPDVTAALPGDDALARGCVEEVLRMESPVHFLARSAPAGVDLGGVPIDRDDNVLLLIAAANRDPARFPDPDRFDPRRDGPPSLAFGVGLHFCLGSAVSRLEGRLALPRLFARFPRLAVTQPYTYSGSLFLRGIDKLFVTTGEAG
ncbi:cytochrome P450 [Micromonospora aurantiaca (nom. illeg.)]|uniref:Cytochrome P450 n=1 Tax=Micromonospora aurantiaca (nom. illeg.) TaxID=47850 RepID=A0A6N3K8Z5_9ACTN|nr:cytochrome P450 [Micromonospora aurantiaca]AXH92934.1 cytochrome P450 [Micromonospora aurantiaca]KAB1113253.1 cytochrome P450 [Micromonospora aurantiaca]MBC9002453.1 cytochrome P450 [Micromonospora aurantiaca]UFN91796.1 cytochrome P450 [Micromonospora aurantiaca]